MTLSASDVEAMNSQMDVLFTSLVLLDMPGDPFPRARAILASIENGLIESRLLLETAPTKRLAKALRRHIHLLEDQRELIELHLWRQA